MEIIIFVPNNNIIIVTIYSYAVELVKIEEVLEGVANSTVENCKYDNEIFKEWYYCGQKIMFFLSDRTWKRTGCYTDINITDLCSIQKYLSEIESVCPPQTLTTPIPARVPRPISFVTFLSSLRNRNDIGLDWIADRIELHKSYWMDRQRSPVPPKYILVFLGLLNEHSDMKIRSGLTTGGPLGELVQWADIISALTALGHQVTVLTRLR